MDRIEQIKQIAIVVREKLCKQYDLGNEPPKALCLQFSRKLVVTLKNNGFIDAKVFQGKFLIDNPDPEAYSDWNVEDFDGNAEIMQEEMCIEVDNLVVDITADQFNDELEDEQVESVVIDNYCNLDR